MAARNRSRTEARRLVLADDLRIGSARQAFESLAPVEGIGAVEIDASQVARVDAAGLQALVAALRRLRAHRIDCRWQNVSGALASAAKLAGLESALGLE